MFDLVLLGPEHVRPLRVREYLQLIKAGAFEDERVELLGGVLVAMSPQGPEHAFSVAELAQRLSLAIGLRASVRPQCPIEIDGVTMPEPDVAVVPRVRGRVRRHPRTAYLVVEVAATSRRKDRELKPTYYAAAGIAEYWIVDLVRGVVEVLTDPDGTRYRSSRTLRRGDVLRPIKLRGVAITVSDILPPRRSRRVRRTRH